MSAGTKHFHLDHLGTPRRITGTGTPAALLASHDYYPYGMEATTSADGERMKFTGHERGLQGTPATQTDDLDYMHARFYSPITGRFLSVDPARGRSRRPQSWNRYAYVVGNPIKYVDDNGQWLRLAAGPGSASARNNLIHMAMRPTLRQLLIGLGTLQNFTAVWKGQDITPRPIVDRMVKMHETKRVVDGTSRATPGWCPPYTGSVTAVDTNMLERVRHDREGTRTGAHELVHVLAIARQEQLETVQNDDKPKNETGAAAQAGGVLAEEEPDWTYDAAADLIDQLLGLQPADSEDEGAIVWVAPTDQE